MENVKFIEEKMKGIEKRIDALRCEIDILDTAIYSTLFMSSLSEREKAEITIEFINKQREYKKLKCEHKNFNNVRLQLLGLN